MEEKPVFHLPSTISCVSGFLVNFVDKTVKLISPWKAEDRWPRGYVVYDEGTFTDATSFLELLDRIVERTMYASVKELSRVRFRRGLTFDGFDDGFALRDNFNDLVVREKGAADFLRYVGRLVNEGERTASEICITAFYKYNAPEQDTMAFLDMLFRKGVLDEEPA